MDKYIDSEVGGKSNPEYIRNKQPRAHPGYRKQVVVGGESGREARVCDYDWVKAIRDACVEKNVAFRFKQTGTHFRKEGHLYQVARQLRHAQARKAGISFQP